MMKIIVFTGAGVSKESGLDTFRTDSGLWENHRLEDVATYEGWQRNPQLVLDFYNMRRQQALKAQPNAAHKAIAELAQKNDVIVITQNIDDLHERAGSQQVIHLHGEILKVKADHPRPVILDWGEDLNLGELCPHLNCQLRPDVVWFGEAVPRMQEAVEISKDADVLIVVGTSLSVWPAADVAMRSRAPRKYLIDPNPPAAVPLGFSVVAETATIGVPLVARQLLCSD